VLGGHEPREPWVMTTLSARLRYIGLCCPLQVFRPHLALIATTDSMAAGQHHWTFLQARQLEPTMTEGGV